MNVPTIDELDGEMLDYWKRLRAEASGIPSSIPATPVISVETRTMEKREESIPDVKKDEIRLIENVPGAEYPADV